MILMDEIQVHNMDEKVTAKRPGFLRRLLWLFVSPGKLMAALAEKPRVLFWLIFAGIAAILPYIIRMPMYKDYLRASMLASSDYLGSFGIEMTPEMIEASLPASVVTGLVGASLGTYGGLLVMALIFFAILKIMGGQGKYKAYLSVMVHANIISVLYYLMLIPISGVTGSFHQLDPLTSLAVLADPAGMNPYLYGLLYGIDILSIWRYVIMAIGFTEVSKLKKKHVYIAMTVIFLLNLIRTVVEMPVNLQILQ